jgi:hypothetical protein
VIPSGVGAKHVVGVSAPPSEWDDTTRVRAFREKLNKRMREALGVQVNTPERDDFEAWETMAQTLAVNMEGEDNLRKANSSNNNNTGNRNGNNGNTAKAKDPDAMDLDQMRVNLAKIPEDEKLRRVNDGLCFNCGKAGHIARNCRSPTNLGRGGRGGQRGGGQRGGGNQRGNFGGYNYGNQGQGHWQGPPQNYFGPQQQPGSGDNSGGYFNGGYQQQPQWPQTCTNYQGQQARRGGTRGGYAGGPRVNFMGVTNPGRVVGEVESENNWGG